MDIIEHTPEKVSGIEWDVSEAFTIVPIGDLQLMQDIESAGQINLDGFRRHMNYVEDTYPNPLYLGMGDYIDFMSPSNRDSLKKAKVYQQSREYIDEAARGLSEEFVALVKEQTQGKWLGMLSGHHFYEYSDGTTTDQYIARELDAPFLGRCGHITVKLTGHGKVYGGINIWAHHGEGARKYPAGKIVDNVAPHWPEVDLFFMGHMHESDAARIARFTVDSQGDLVTRNSLAVVTGAWLEPSVAGQSTYIEDKMLRPRATGAPVVLVEPYQDEKKRRRRRFRYISEV